jgi:DNA-binding CsgD family transcriptional regulator
VLRHDDLGLRGIVLGLLRVTGTSGCRLQLRLKPSLAVSVFTFGEHSGPSVATLRIDHQRFDARCELFGTVPVRSGALRDWRPYRELLRVGLELVLDRCKVSTVLGILADSLTELDLGAVLVGASGEVLYCNRLGMELRATHDGEAGSMPALAQVIASAGERQDRQLAIRIGARHWLLAVQPVRLGEDTGIHVGLLKPTCLPDAETIQARLTQYRITPRQAQVLALVVGGARAKEVAVRLGITEYTVKDHLKHAYARLDIASRGQLLARLAASGVALT